MLYEVITSIRILHATEVEIKADGTLDYPDEFLASLDLVLASLHTSLRQPREKVTERTLNAICNPHVDMIGHPTGRMIPDRRITSYNVCYTKLLRVERDISRQHLCKIQGFLIREHF